MNHVTINFLRRPYRRMPQPGRYGGKRYAARQQVRAVRVPKGAEARALRQLVGRHVVVLREPLKLSRVPSERVNFLYPDIAKDHRGFVGIESEVNAGE
jgi:hypothetical protein